MMSSDQVTKKKRFRPFKFLRKLARGKKHHIESLPTVETAPSEGYHVPPSPEKLFIKEAAPAIANQQADLSQATLQLASTGYSEKIDTDRETVPTAFAINQGPFADPADEGQTVEIFEDGVEEEMESLRATRQNSLTSLIRTEEIRTNSLCGFEIEIGRKTPNLHSTPTPEPTPASEPALVLEPTPASKQVPESAPQQIVQVNIMEQLVGSCVGPLPHISSMLSPVPTAKVRTFAPPAIQRAQSASVNDNIQSQMVDPAPIVQPGFAAEGESKCVSPAVSIPLTMQRSRTAPAMYGDETAGKSMSHRFSFFPKCNVKVEPNGVEVETANTPALIVGDLEKHEDFILAMRTRSYISLKSKSEKEACSPSRKVPSANKAWLVSSTVHKAHDHNEVEHRPQPPPMTVAARRQLMVSPPPPSAVVPRRTVAAVPRTAPLTTENLYAASRLSRGMSELDNSVNMKYDDDQDTTFDLDSEAGTSYTGAAESGYNSEDTGSMFVPATERGGVATDDEDDYFQPDDDRSTVFLTDGEEEGMDEEDDDDEEDEDEEDDDGTVLENLGGELIEMVSELHKGGSDVLMSWLDMRLLPNKLE